jgi:hypothetical protein
MSDDIMLPIERATTEADAGKYGRRLSDWLGRCRFRR